ncbi:MAG: exodeoxyribonuclease V subunit gamma [Intrasporangium sp.]|uniref:exodeoxyribonuclease V subunit gamma n=1 Tax=Intrasporangium sp. TaxID=1925024 RepID=UPI0026490F84|nr:exodeoxyribonuclease V subunit gamma [Intrasporangium sp.]MDN5796056.1 exodeoxyribonuclease V subunit gamma [Intrasporangium sp.]
MGIQLHRSDRPEALAAEFAELLRTDPADVFTPEVVVVAARGVERWLAQQLSHSLGATLGDDGVCAGLQILAPQSLVSLLLGRERDDPWQPDRLVWPTLAAIDELVGARHFEALTHHLGAGPEIVGDPAAEWERKARQSRRYAVARRVAGLFASYARERPELLADWEAGKPTDGQREKLPPDFEWQPILWRRVVEVVLARGDADESVVERHRRVVKGLARDALELKLPVRLSFFGHTRLAVSELELLAALGTHREVHLWLPHPSPQLWTDLSRRVTRGPREDDRSAESAQHPLLATLGRDVRELQETLSSCDPVVLEPAPPATTSTTGTTRLGLLQADVRANRAPDETRTTAADDLSIQVHACHGRARQVEVLREVLLWLLAEREGDLQPRDVIVMCPDIEHFAPLIQATFGLSLVTTPDAPTAHHPGQRLRVQLADRSLGATNPLIDLAHRILTVVAGRMTATEVLDLAGHESVRARFGFDEDALARVSRWVTDAGVRWGYDAVHRGEYGLRAIASNTWTRGMDRIALGVAVAADSATPAAARMPIDDIGSRDIEVVGRFLELMERLKVAADAVRGTSRVDGILPRGVLTAQEWMHWLSETIDALADTPMDQHWQLAQLRRDLAAIGEAAGERTTLRLNDIRVLLEQRWGTRPTRANFRTGAVTVCTMVPMRSVPHKAVVLLGVDDDVYPRSPITDGDDILARRPMVGERDARSEDRQLLLDAVMAASEHFVAVYSGFDERNGSRRPPAVPLQELISVAARTARTGSAPSSERSGGTDGFVEPGFVRLHPLQPFDERNFRADGPLPGGTFDRVALDGATALRVFRRDRPDPHVFLSEPLPLQPVSAVTVDELVTFLQNPAREFLRNRLEVTVPRELDEIDDSLPIAIDPLEKWTIGDRVLQAVLDGSTVDEALRREVARGSFPPGVLGEPARSEIAKHVASIAGDRGSGPARSVDVRVDLPSPRGGMPVRLTGVISGVHQDTLWVPTYSTISAKHIAAAWVRLLALAVAEPDREHLAQLSGKKGGQRLRSPLPGHAAGFLRELAGVRQSGMRFPIGIPPKTASEFTRVHRPGEAGGRAEVDAALGRVRAIWEGSDRYPGESDDPWWGLVLGTHSRVEELDRRNGIGYFAPVVWKPIHDHGGGS